MEISTQDLDTLLGASKALGPLDSLNSTVGERESGLERFRAALPVILKYSRVAPVREMIERYKVGVERNPYRDFDSGLPEEYR